KNINADFTASEHQFFCIGAAEGGFEYEYKDSNVGFEGQLKVVKATNEGFALKIVLRHGLSKNHAAAQIWNNPTYASAGGTDDLLRTFEIHPVAEDAHDH